MANAATQCALWITLRDSLLAQVISVTLGRRLPRNACGSQRSKGRGAERREQFDGHGWLGRPSPPVTQELARMAASDMSPPDRG